MKRVAATLALVAGLATASVAISSEEASANPVIFGIAAWKFIAIAATSALVGGLVVGSAAANANAYPYGRQYVNGCPVHIARSDGHRYIRRNCT